MALTLEMTHVLLNTQDSPTSPVSVNYCQLSSPGYKEEELRRGDTEALGGDVQEFIIEDLTCSSCSSGTYNGFNSRNSQKSLYHSITSLTLTPNTTAHFSLEEGRYLVAKSPGFYGISVSAQIQVYAGNEMIIGDYGQNKQGPSFPRHSVVRLEKGDKLSMKTTYSLKSATEGSKLFIVLIS